MRITSAIQILSEVGTPGGRDTGAGNLVEPMPKNDVPSLKKRKKPISPEEAQELEKELMPDDAEEREDLHKRRIGKSGGLQTW